MTEHLESGAVVNPGNSGGRAAQRGKIAFVLGGGGHLGAVQVGMLRALIAARIRPDLILGTSVGAINGMLIGADPSPTAVAKLVDLWTAIESSGVLSGSVLHRAGTLARTRTHLHRPERLRALLSDSLRVTNIEDLSVEFQCVAASIERAAEHWFTSGPIVDAVLASCALPGVLPPAIVAGEHFIDGGIVNSIPVGRAVELGARHIYVLQVGRVDSQLRPPRWPWEVGLVTFEIARRHRFISDMAVVPAGVQVHVLPTGIAEPSRFNGLSQLRYRDFSKAASLIERAHDAARDYLVAHAIADEAKNTIPDHDTKPEDDLA